MWSTTTSSLKYAPAPDLRHLNAHSVSDPYNRKSSSKYPAFSNTSFLYKAHIPANTSVNLSGSMSSATLPRCCTHDVLVTLGVTTKQSGFFSKVSINLVSQQGL